MEHKPCDPFCVLQVDVNCCQGCQIKLKKKLLSLNDVLSVEYDTRNKWATVRGKCKPSVLVKCIEKMGKAAQVVSCYKDPTKAPASVLNNNNNNTQDKSCHTKGKKKASSASSDGDDDNDDDDFDDGGKQFNRSKEKKHYHKHEDYAPPPKVDESICKDQFCPIHRRSVNTAASMNGPMYWNHPGQMGAVRGQSFGRFGMPYSYPQPHPYGYHAPPGMTPPGYGFYPDQVAMPGVEFTSNYFRDENPARGCNTM